MSTKPDNGFVRRDIDGPIATVTFSHPKGNSLPGILLAELTTAIKAVAADSQVQVLILQSEGKTFCAGASFDELLALKDVDEGRNFFMGFAHVLLALNEIPQIVIGKVQGKAVGGGVGLIAGCDYVIATEAAAVRLSELAIGIGPFVISPAVQRKIGLAQFSRMTLTTNWYSAKECLVMGLFDEVISGTDKLEERAQEFAATLSTRSAEASHSIKQVLRHDTANWKQLMAERATFSGTLALSPTTQKVLQEFRK